MVDDPAIPPIEQQPAKAMGMAAICLLSSIQATGTNITDLNAKLPVVLDVMVLCTG